ncbi:hypothetical protein BDV93DRAFT_522634 [Ceratobasidium sp. AG-I]|nr:hypothetical protein BDV93DRAFT_522634 [Ceratobasidium sp. AG-I]
MLRCRRWAANVLLVAGSGSRIKNVEKSGQIYRQPDVFQKRLGSHGSRSGRGSSMAGTNEDHLITAQRQKLTSPELDTQSTGLASLQLLRSILAKKQTFDASLLQSAYTASETHLSYLTISEFSTLIALFGALSTHSDASQLPPTSSFSLSLAQCELLLSAPKKDFCSWWNFVLRLGSDQNALGRCTSDVDRYWLMLGSLSCCLSYFRSWGSSSKRHHQCTTRQSQTCNEPQEINFIDASTPAARLPPPTMQYLMHAHVYYTTLAKNHLDESLHYSYLQRLFDIHQQLFLTPAITNRVDPTLFNIVHSNLASALEVLLSKHRFQLGSSLSSLIWDILSAADFEPRQTKPLLAVLRSRFTLSTTPRTYPSTPSVLLDPISSLRRAILDPATSDDPWVLREAYAVTHDVQAWDWLMLLSGRPQTHPPQASSSSLSSGPSKSLTRVNVLAILHRLEHALGKEKEVGDVAIELERLWDGWMGILGSEAGESGDLQTEIWSAGVDRATLLALLRLAAVYRSTRIVYGAERLLAVHHAIVFEQDGVHAVEGLDSPKESLCVAFGAACACLETSNLAVLLARTRAAGFTVDGKGGRLPHEYLTKVVELLLDLGAPRVAWSLLHQLDAPAPAKLLAAVASACAQSGHITEATSLLATPQLESNEKLRIAVECLHHIAAQRIVLNRDGALHLFQALGPPHLGHVPKSVRYAAARLALDAGLVRLAGVMGAKWKFGTVPRRMIAVRLVKAGLAQMAYEVIEKSDVRWLRGMIRNVKGTGYGGEAGPRIPDISQPALSDDATPSSTNDAVRRGNIHLARASRSRRRRLGGRAQTRATLATLAWLIRSGAPPGNGNRNAASLNHDGAKERASFVPDRVTLNLVVRALARCTSGVSAAQLRALFDELARIGFCGLSCTEGCFGTEDGHAHMGFATSAVALARMIDGLPGQSLFIRHTRPLLKTFVRGFYLRRDEEAARVVVGVLKAEQARWRLGSEPVRGRVRTF